MSFYKFEGDFYSDDSKRKINYFIYEPKCEIKGVLQISHGMCEYIERYEDFADFMTENGWLVCGNDHLGHGKAAKERDELGYFTENDGWKHAVNDLHSLHLVIEEKYGKYPYVLLGHSMGSFIARAYMIKYSSYLDGAVIVGTSAGSPRFSTAQIMMVEKFKAKEGEKSRCAKLSDIVFGSYNNKIENPASAHDWLSRDEEIVEKYDNDELCNFIFTTNGFENLVKVLNYVSADKWYESVKTNLPVLLLSGKEDPVGSYGKGVYKVFEKLCENGCDARIKLYSGMRHEILNEIGKEEAYKDVLSFCEQVKRG